jgi:hypothetical protein
MRTFVVPPVLAIVGAAASVALAACGGARPVVAVSPPVAPVVAPAALASSAVPAAAPIAVVPARAVRRSAVHAIVTGGLGAFLQRVDVDDQPVFIDGRFHGFRIAALRDSQSWTGFWGGVDLKPGDVVTGVNGFPIERPEQALTAFDSLEVASELRVAYERGGEARQLVYPIVDDR